MNRPQPSGNLRVGSSPSQPAGHATTLRQTVRWTAHSLVAVLVILLAAAHSAVQAQETTYGPYTVLTYTLGGTPPFDSGATFTVPQGVTKIDYLVVGGGGAGGKGSSSNVGGGGGAGQFVQATSVPVTPGSNHTITVGAGGSSQTSTNTNGQNGSNSSISGIVTAYGGIGGGGNGASNVTGNNAQASAGGAGASSTAVPVGPIGGQGNGGASAASGSSRGAGGGGGAGAVGGNGVAGTAGAGGAGGTGRESGITGTVSLYAAGGGGAGTSSGGAGGSGLGGNGTSSSNGAALAGTPHTGSGGGGSRNGDSGAGGSGIVIIRYLTPGVPLPITAQGDETHYYQIGPNIYTAYTYNSNNSFVVPSGVTQLEYLIIGGGGGGGRGQSGEYQNVGGGGGAGEFEVGILQLGQHFSAGDTLQITVGAGGAGATSTNTNGSAGQLSRIVNQTSNTELAVAYGGGGGGGNGNAPTPNPRGSGGGAGAAGNSPTNSIVAAGASGQQGNAGGSSYRTITGGGGAFRAAGGGGGAGGPGANGSGSGDAPVGGAGGVGLSSDVKTGWPEWYAGGGGGAANSQLGGGGGKGGSLVGGRGASVPSTYTSPNPNLVTYGLPGLPNTGSGGGGGRGTGGGGNGGSGIVVLRFFQIDPTLSVDLLSFEAKASGVGSPVTITWETAAEHDNSGFNVYRAANGAPGQKLNAFPIAAQGTETEGASYSFVDSDPIGANEVRGYYLEDVEFSGAKELHGPVSVGPFSGTSSAVDSWAMYD